MANFAKVFDVGYTKIIAFKRGAKLLNSKDSRSLEEKLSMPQGWLDEEREALPEELSLRLKHATRTSARENTPEMQERRKANVFWLIGTAHGAKSQFARHVAWHVVEIQQIKARPFGPKRAETLEGRLGLPLGWLDIEHRALDLPDDFEDRLATLQKLSPLPVVAQDTVPAPLEALAPSAEDSLEATLASISSPVSRALVEKLIGLARLNLLPDLTAIQMLSALVQLEAGLPSAIA